MRVSIDIDGYIHIEAQNNAEKFALRWHLKAFEGRESAGVVFHEEELSKSECATKAET